MIGALNMKKNLIAIGLGICVAAAVPLVASPQVLPSDQNLVVKEVSLEQIRGALTMAGQQWVEVKDSEGLASFQIKEGDLVVASLYQYRDAEDAPVTSLGMSAGYDLLKPMEWKKVNSWNANTRYSKAFLDDEGDPYLTEDMLTKSGVTLGAIAEMVKGFRASQKQFESEVLGRNVTPKS